MNINWSHEVREPEEKEEGWAGGKE